MTIRLQTKKPETPTVLGLILQSYAMGILMFLQTILLVSYGHLFLSEQYEESMNKSLQRQGGEMDIYMETCIFLQISNSSAILILSARTLGFFFSTMPAWQLFLSTAIGQVIVNAWVFSPPGKELGFGRGLVAKLDPQDMARIWGYDLLWLLFLDLVKMTAGGIWEKFKPADIDRNPALEAKNRKSRRVSNNLMPHHAAVLQPQDKEKVLKRRSSKL